MATLLAVDGFEDGERGHEPRQESGLWNLERGRARSSPEPPEGSTALLTPPLCPGEIQVNFLTSGTVR